MIIYVIPALVFVVIILVSVLFNPSTLKNRSTDVDINGNGDVIKFLHIINWRDLLAFAEIEPDANDNIIIPFPGINAKAILCSPAASCPNLNVSFQPPSLVAVGGICGIDFMPTTFNGKLERIFLLPQLKGPKGEPAAEGPRGIIVSSTGYVFDVAGGCEACISIVPRLDQQVIVSPQNVRVVPVVVAGNYSLS